jgi:hypothetical protein
MPGSPAPDSLLIHNFKSNERSVGDEQDNLGLSGFTTFGRLCL